MKKRKTLADLSYNELLDSLKFAARQIGSSQIKTELIMRELFKRNQNKDDKH